MISPAISEIEASMHSQSAEIWWNFWPVLYRPSKTAGDIILKTVFLHSQSIHLLEFIISSSCSFILLRSSLQWGVICCIYLCMYYIDSIVKKKKSKKIFKTRCLTKIGYQNIRNKKPICGVGVFVCWIERIMHTIPNAGIVMSSYWYYQISTYWAKSWAKEMLFRHFFYLLFEEEIRKYRIEWVFRKN